MAFLMTRISFSITETLSAQRRGFILFFSIIFLFFLESQQNTFTICSQNLINFLYFKKIIGRVNNFHRHTLKKETKSLEGEKNGSGFDFWNKRFLNLLSLIEVEHLILIKAFSWHSTRQQAYFMKITKTPLLWISYPDIIWVFCSRKITGKFRSIINFSLHRFLLYTKNITLIHYCFYFYDCLWWRT